MRRRIENPDKKKKVIKRYNATSDYYEKRYTEIQYEKYNLLKDYSLKNKFILDAGCGTGLLFDFINNSIEVKDLACVSYIAVDISINMLRIFKSKIKKRKRKMFNSINLILSDLENLPIRDKVFHLIFSLTSLQNLPNIINGVNELFRVARNNSNIKLSILKKNLDIKEIVSFINPKTIDLEITNKESLEDIIIQGKILKE